MAFTRGIIPRMCINVPSTALSWGTYEIIKTFLNVRKSTKEWLNKNKKMEKFENTQ